MGIGQNIGMNKNLLAILIAAALCCLGGMFMMSKVLQEAKQVQEAALTFCKKDVEPVFKTWDLEMLKKISHPELLRNNPESEMKAAFAKMSAKFGPLKEVTAWKNTGFDKTNKVDGKPAVSVNIAGDAIFTKGRATLKLKLIRPTDIWMLANVQVDQVGG